jgi:hypothetical protein
MAPPSQSPSPTDYPAPVTFEYVRFLAGGVPIRSEPAGGDSVEWTVPNQVAAVLERASVGDVEWLRVEVGSSRIDYRARFGWVPRAAEVAQGGGVVHVDPVYEAVAPGCPNEAPTITSVAGMLPALALQCYGSQTLRFAPVMISYRHSTEGAGVIDAEPLWLTFESFWVYDSHDGAPSTSMGLQLDPASVTTFPPTDQWVEIEAQFGHPASGTCRVTENLPYDRVADSVDPVRWCREQLVVSAVRALPDSDRPPSPAPPPPPGPPVARTIDVTTREITGPLERRFYPSAVWTGSEVIVWGGSDPRTQAVRLLSDGAAYDPGRDRWRMIADGPLAEREQHLAVWTGTEMLVWGGRTRNYIEPPDGAAYDPATDRWRRIADGPLEWEVRATSVWTGTEWVIASTGRDARTRVAAYDPVSDSWRRLPSLDADSSRYTKSLTWTGDELILQDQPGNLKRLPKDAPEWIAVPFASDIRVVGPIEWTGDNVIAIAAQSLGGDDPQFWYFLAAWDPDSDEWLALPQAPTNNYGRLVWADGRAIVLESDLAYDVTSKTWWEVPMPDFEADYGNAVVWAGDRLFVWGGGLGHGTTPNEAGSVTIPDW